MNINELTVGQVKEISELLNAQNKKSNLYVRAIGKYVIVRSQNEGMNFGKVVEADETGIALADARRIWYHEPEDKSQVWYEGVANSGLGKDSKISSAVSMKVIVEDYSMTFCTDKAIKSLLEFKSHEQN